FMSTDLILSRQGDKSAKEETLTRGGNSWYTGDTCLEINRVALLSVICCGCRFPPVLFTSSVNKFQPRRGYTIGLRSGVRRDVAGQGGCGVVERGSCPALRAVGVGGGDGARQAHVAFPCALAVGASPGCLRSLSGGL